MLKREFARVAELGPDTYWTSVKVEIAGVSLEFKCLFTPVSRVVAFQKASIATFTETV